MVKVPPIYIQYSNRISLRLPNLVPRDVNARLVNIGDKEGKSVKSQRLKEGQDNVYDELRAKIYPNIWSKFHDHELALCVVTSARNLSKPAGLRQRRRNLNIESFLFQSLLEWAEFHSFPWVEYLNSRLDTCHLFLKSQFFLRKFHHCQKESGIGLEQMPEGMKVLLSPFSCKPILGDTVMNYSAWDTK